MRAFLQAKLDAMQAKEAAATIRRNWKTIRSEGWAVQACLRAMLRKRTGRKLAVVLMRTPRMPTSPSPSARTGTGSPARQPGNVSPR